jgi:trehalose 6-phosphate synthase
VTDSRTELSDLAILSNRLPVRRVKRAGKSEWKMSSGGLVTALTPILRRRQSQSVWIGWTGAAGRAPEPFQHEGILNWPVRLSADDVRDFYEGFSNRTLWPLYHDALRPPEYHRYWWRPYLEVNQRFAEIAANRLAPNGMAWVQDYHLQLVPALLREMRPDVRIGFFLHIPFPPQELYSQLPWRQQLLEGMLGADVVGFQTPHAAQNFMRLANRYTEATGARGRLHYRSREVRVDAFPISIDYDYFAGLAASEEVATRMARLASRIGSRKVILGVDRLDYTKGIDNRLRAFHEMLQRGNVTDRDVLLVQVAVPSRERVAEYRDLRHEVERLVGEINGEYGELGRVPVHYMHRSVDQAELVALYRVADVMAVTPYRDGMNLVAKEYAAARLDDSGVLLLSEFTGSAHELRQAMLINPYDIDGMSLEYERALEMPLVEQRRRMRALRRTIRRNDVFQWADRFIDAMFQV